MATIAFARLNSRQYFHQRFQRAIDFPARKRMRLLQHASTLSPSEAARRSVAFVGVTAQQAFNGWMMIRARGAWWRISALYARVMPLIFPISAAAMIRPPSGDIFIEIRWLNTVPEILLYQLVSRHVARYNFSAVASEAAGTIGLTIA